MQKQVMIKAVRLARKMEGDWVARMKMSLKMAWAIIKKQANETVKRPIEIMKEKLEKEFNKPTLGTSLESLKLNIWEKYGKVRIYVNGHVSGYFDFDENMKVKKSYFDCGYDYKTQNELRSIAGLINIGEI